MQTVTRLDRLLAEARACRVCEHELPLGANPVLRAGYGARILIVGQAPGIRVHRTGVPWNDPSGKRLREWMDLEDCVFYDERRVAIIPMGFCYPGKGPSGDLPPRKECAPLWHKRLLDMLPEVQLVLLVGQYAQKYYLANPGTTLADTVRRWKQYGPRYFPLPHPSPRNIGWLKKNSWFESETVPQLRKRIHAVLHGRPFS